MSQSKHAEELAGEALVARVNLRDTGRLSDKACATIHCPACDKTIVVIMSRFREALAEHKSSGRCTAPRELPL